MRESAGRTGKGPTGWRCAPRCAIKMRAMERLGRWGAAVAGLAAALLHAAPTAAADPTFTFAPPDKVPHTGWKASAQAGVNASTGNALSLSMSATGSVSHRSGDDQRSLDVFASFRARA